MKSLLCPLAFACLLAACRQPNTPKTTAQTAPQIQPSYREPHRPQFHFSPPQNWMNDPNGLVYFEGEWHLFYQYHPASNIWGPMHWAHAVSRDLVRWENLPIALAPDERGYIFSGSAVVDWQNTSGFGLDGKPPLVAMFTYHDMAGEKAKRLDFESQGIAYSRDRGRTWTKFAGNPVIPNPGAVKDFRDPKMVWHEASKRWLVTIAVGDHAEFWASPDFRKWEKLSAFGAAFGQHGNVWECPNFAPMNVEKTGEQKWVLIQNCNPGAPNGGSGAQYFVGDFDGTNFTLDADFQRDVSDGKSLWLDYGKDNYAGVTWSDAPGGRSVLIGWMSNWDYAMQVPTEAWRSACTLPIELSLRKTALGYRLFTRPVRELEALRGEPTDLPAGELPVFKPLNNNSFSPTLSEMDLEFEPAAGFAGTFGVEISNVRGEYYRIGFDVAKNQFFSNRTHSGDHSFSKTFADKIHVAPRSATAKTVRLHLFFDRASCELFADDGATQMTNIFFPTEDFNGAGIFAEGGKLRLVRGRVWPMRGIW